jgi:hypothetical protein
MSRRRTGGRERHETAGQTRNSSSGAFTSLVVGGIVWQYAALHRLRLDGLAVCRQVRFAGQAADVVGGGGGITGQ